MSFLTSALLSLGGYAFHVLKMLYEAINRNEKFVTKSFWVSMAMNIVAIVILTYIGNQLPPDLLVMSPLTSVIIGFSGASMLAGFINVKKPKDALPDVPL